MTPRATTAARVATSTPPRPALRPSLRPLPSVRPASTAPLSRWSRLRRRLSPVSIAVGFVVICLLAVVIGNMQLAAGQLRLSQLQAQVVAVQSSEAVVEAQNAALSSPAAIAHDIPGLGLGQANEILTIPAVSLEKRLAPPSFSYAPCCSLTPGR
jgi:hypothetical protein